MEKQKAIFWDRDGVLNYVVAEREDGEQNSSPQKFEDFKLAGGIAEILSEVKAKGYLNIIATKQPDIARGKMTREELDKMHGYLKKRVPAIAAVYVCPHDDKDNCNCRKPKPGLLLHAAKDYNLDLKKCFMVGDGQKDVDAAKNAGVKSILLKAPYNGQVKFYNFAIENLSEIIRIISQ